ncbi:hypothetical protein J437_LFUL002353 [Ladona fulva]|uniref:Uncharacterized protein n=1 Tax=Ladona fulva TaxID=123851 RepID=A0A8K0K858_LADFU|nr:hypothetical protein J437_LFUL002353 [Ladona fulva]
MQLNECKWTITGTIKSTPTFWLPVLSNIEPPSICHSKALLKEYGKVKAAPQLLIHQHLPLTRHLRSRKPPATVAEELLASNFEPRASSFLESLFADSSNAGVSVVGSFSISGFVTVVSFVGTCSSTTLPPPPFSL